MVDPFDTDGAWQRALHDTRLGAYEHAAVPVEDAFAPLWDALGDEVDRGAATRRHWLAGRHDSRRAVVRASASWQVHVVEIDPPLCLGMCASKGPADSEPTLEGFPADWVAALFRTEPEARALGEALAGVAAPWDAVVGDSFVHVGLGGYAPGDDRTVEGLRRASALAEAVERLREQMPLPPWRTTILRELRELEAMYSLVLDAPRMRARGKVGGLEVSFDVELSRSGALLTRGLRAIARFDRTRTLDGDPADARTLRSARLEAVGATATLHDDRVEASIDELPDRAGLARSLVEGAIEAALKVGSPGAPGPYR